MGPPVLLTNSWTVKLRVRDAREGDLPLQLFTVATLKLLLWAVAGLYGLPQLLAQVTLSCVQGTDQYEPIQSQSIQSQSSELFFALRDAASGMQPQLSLVWLG
jgi:hypothetical protein